tara:strand:- start:540 stop:2285 length:1746 start_codon:yes stop_codon:yes gene_type:complete
MNRLYVIYQNRINLFKHIVLSITLIILSKFFIIQTISSSSYRKQIDNKTISYKDQTGLRGNIYDSNKNLLAYSIKKCLFWINSENLQEKNKSQIIDLFSKELNKSSKVYESILNSKSKYLVIEKDIILNDYKGLVNKSKNIEHLRVDFYDHRLYPYNELAAQLIGFTNNDNIGRYGIEGYFNNLLSGHNAIVEYNKTASGKTKLNENITNLAKNGADIELTIDIKLQEILQNQLKNAFIKNNAKSANGIILNPNSGEILAIASLPDFDLNKYYELPIDSAEKYYLNRPISSAYEPGSTFKIICFADALENNFDKIKDTYFCENGFYKGKYIDPFKDHDEGYDSLSFDEIFSKSSNIGTVKIFQDLEPKSFHERIKRFGFGIKTNISISDEHKGDMKSLRYYRNNIRDLASVSIGQSILVTNIQLASAYASIANGGYILKPKIIKNIKSYTKNENFHKPTILHKSISSETASRLLSMLKKTVDEGTAKKARISGFSSGGKTGTGEIWDLVNKEYSKTEYISSFASIFPIENPKYVLIISLEAPSYNKRWGGESAVPCAKNIIEKIIFYDKELKLRKAYNDRA